MTVELIEPSLLVDDGRDIRDRWTARVAGSYSVSEVHGGSPAAELANASNDVGLRTRRPPDRSAGQAVRRRLPAPDAGATATRTDGSLA